MFRKTVALFLAVGFVSAANLSGEERPFLGVRLTDSASVEHVFPDSPADKAGLKPGDVLLKIGDHEVTSTEDFMAQLRTSKPLDEVAITLMRDEGEVIVKPVLAKLSVRWILAQEDPPRVAGGTIQLGGGTIAGDFRNVGNMVFAGPSQIHGSFTQDWSGVLEVSLTKPGAETSVTIGGKASLAGLLSARLEGEMPKKGDKFEILTAGEGFEGRFDEVRLPKLAEGLAWLVKYDAVDEGRDIDRDGKSDVTIEVVDADTIMPEVEP